MNQQTEKAKELYLALRNKVDIQVQGVLAQHGDNIVCKPGCCECCVNLSVFPVEYAAIADELASRGDIVFDKTATCGFLCEGLCQIYASRPIICRTHGMPIVFLDDDPADPAYSVSFCPQNFPDGGYDIEFSADNTINIDELNDMLYEINQQYVESLKNQDINEQTRIELSDLVL